MVEETFSLLHPIWSFDGASSPYLDDTARMHDVNATFVLNQSHVPNNSKEPIRRDIFQ
ncbi:MAG: hypothetical protein ACYCSP_15435 [Acidobacteriaceae bacterium]